MAMATPTAPLRDEAVIWKKVGPTAQNACWLVEGHVMRRSFVGLACATFILFASSSASLVVKLGETDDPAVVAAAGATRERDLSEVDPRPADDKVKLLDAGVEPRRPLRIRPVFGSTIETVMEGRIRLDTQIDGQSVSMGPAPGFRMLLVQRVDRVQPNGTAQFAMTYTAVGAVGGPGIDPALVAEVNAAIGDLEGLTGSAEVDARGQVQRASFDTGQVSDPVAKSLLDSVSSQVRNLSAPFPYEPVGVGARWTVEDQATLVGITMDSTATYTLTAREGDSYELGVTGTATATSQTIAFPGMPKGAEATVSRFEVRTTGTAAGDVGDILPSTSQMSAEGDIVIRVTEGGQAGRVVQHLEMEFTAEPFRR